MGFWIFMFLLAMLAPTSMIGFGRYFVRKAPQQINEVFGYRSIRSMKNRETWEFAHRYFGRIWYIGGLILLPLSVLIMAITVGRSSDVIGYTGTALITVQMILLVGAIPPTEHALKKNFDDNGMRKQDPGMQ